MYLCKFMDDRFRFLSLAFFQSHSAHSPWVISSTPGISYCKILKNSNLLISTVQIVPEFQTCISKCLIGKSTGMSPKHLTHRHVQKEIHSFPFYLPPSYFPSLSKWSVIFPVSQTRNRGVLSSVISFNLNNELITNSYQFLHTDISVLCFFTSSEIARVYTVITILSLG